MKAKGGRAAGVPNYQNDVLINVIEAVLPDGPLQWSIVAQRYQEASGEREIRDGHDIKRHFTTHKSLCNNGKKVTGSSAPKPQVARCQDIWQKILRKSAASNCGGGSSSDDMSETENERESFVDENFDDDTQFDDNEYAESTENLTDNNDEIPEPRDLPPRVEAQRGIAQLVEAHRLSVLPPRGALDRPIEGHRAPSPLPRVTLRLEGELSNSALNCIILHFYTGESILLSRRTSYRRSTCTGALSSRQERCRCTTFTSSRSTLAHAFASPQPTKSEEGCSDSWWAWKIKKLPK